MGYEGIGNEHANTNPVFNPRPIQFSGKWYKAMGAIGYNGSNKAAATSQHYKYAQGALDEGAGEILGLRDLLKHPKLSNLGLSSLQYGRLPPGVW